MSTCIQFPIMVPSSLRSKSTTTCSSFDMNPKIGWRNYYVRRKRLNYICSSSKFELPPVDLDNPFIRKLVKHMHDNPGVKPTPNSELPPFMDLFTKPTMSSASSSSSSGPSAEYDDDEDEDEYEYDYEDEYEYDDEGSRKMYGTGEHMTSIPPPDIPSEFLNARIIYLGMPLVPAVTELIVNQIFYLQYADDTAPITLYINSTGTVRDDNQLVGLDGEGYAILNAMDYVDNPVETVCIGSAGGYACLLLAAGKLGRRFMLPHCRIVMKASRVTPTGLMQATDVSIYAKEAAMNRDMLFKLFAFYTGHRLDDIKERLKYPLYMGAQEALDFGVVDTILWQGQEEEVKSLLTPEQWEKQPGLKSV